MLKIFPILLQLVLSTAEDYYYNPMNISRTTLSGIAAYRSALTLDWLAAEDSRQRELAAAFETEPAPPVKVLTTDCIAYPRPSAGKIAKLMLELLKNLEGDDGTLVPNLIQSLIRTKILVETSLLDAEPDFEALVRTPGVMMGEPHVTFPRILAMTWLTVTDPASTGKYGWCPINKVNKYLSMTKPIHIAKNMRALEPILARARFIMEEFIQSVTPLNMYQKKTTASKHIKLKKIEANVPKRKRNKTRSLRTHVNDEAYNLAKVLSLTSPETEQPFIDSGDITMVDSASFQQISNFLFMIIIIIL